MWSESLLKLKEVIMPEQKVPCRRGDWLSGVEGRAGATFGGPCSSVKVRGRIFKCSSDHSIGLIEQLMCCHELCQESALASYAPDPTNARIKVIAAVVSRT